MENLFESLSSALQPMSEGFSCTGGLSGLSMHINVHTLFLQESISKWPHPPIPSSHLPAARSHSILLFFATIRLQRLSCRGIGPYSFRLHFVTALILMN